MPYGLPKSKGGDSLKNNHKMESCVSQVLAQNPSYSKDQAIAICKSSLGFTSKKKRKRG